MFSTVQACNPFIRIPFMSRWCSLWQQWCVLPSATLPAAWLLKYYKSFPDSQFTLICCQFITVRSWIFCLVFSSLDDCFGGSQILPQLCILDSANVAVWQSQVPLSLLGAECTEPAQRWSCWSMLREQGWEEHWSPPGHPVPQPPWHRAVLHPSLLTVLLLHHLRPKAPHSLSGFWVSVPAAFADNGACCTSRISFCTMTLAPGWFVT